MGRVLTTDELNAQLPPKQGRIISNDDFNKLQAPEWAKNGAPALEPGDTEMLATMEGMTGGFAGELSGAGRTAAKLLSGEIGLKQVPDTYKKEHKASENIREAAKRQNPSKYYPFEIGGSILPAVATRKVDPTKAIAAMGMLTGMGKAETFEDAPAAGAVGAAEAVAFDKTLRAVGGRLAEMPVVKQTTEAIKRLPDKLQGWARTWALKQIGAIQSEIKKMQQVKGNVGAPFEDKVAERLLTERLVNPISAKRTLDRINEAVPDAEKELGKFLGKIESEAAKVPKELQDATMVDTAGIAAQIGEQAQKLRAADEHAMADQAEQIAKEWLDKPRISIAEAIKKKRAYDSVIGDAGWRRENVGPRLDLKRRVRGMINSGIDAAAERIFAVRHAMETVVPNQARIAEIGERAAAIEAIENGLAKSVGDLETALSAGGKVPDNISSLVSDAKGYRAANARVGQLYEAQRVASKHVSARQRGNREMSPYEVAASVGGFIAGREGDTLDKISLAILTGLATRTARLQGPGVAARTLYGTGEVLRETGNRAPGFLLPAGADVQMDAINKAYEQKKALEGGKPQAVLDFEKNYGTLDKVGVSPAEASALGFAENMMLPARVDTLAEGFRSIASPPQFGPSAETMQQGARVLEKAREDKNYNAAQAAMAFPFGKNPIRGELINLGSVRADKRIESGLSGMIKNIRDIETEDKRGLIKKLEARFAEYPGYIKAMRQAQSGKNTEPYIGGAIEHPIFATSHRIDKAPVPFIPIEGPVDVGGHVGKYVGEGGADPFSWLDSKYGLGKKVLADNATKPLKISTRSDLIAHDDYMSLLNPTKHTVEFHITGDNERLNRVLVPGGPSFDLILRATKKLRAGGIKVSFILDRIDGIPEHMQSYDRLAVRRAVGSDVTMKENKITPDKKSKDLLDKALGDILESHEDARGIKRLENEEGSPLGPIERSIIYLKDNVNDSVKNLQDGNFKDIKEALSDDYAKMLDVAVKHRDSGQQLSPAAINLLDRINKATTPAELKLLVRPLHNANLEFFLEKK